MRNKILLMSLATLLGSTVPSVAPVRAASLSVESKQPTQRVLAKKQPDDQKKIESVVSHDEEDEEAPIDEASLDPLEPFNRVIFILNRVLDTLIMKPVALVYRGVVPEPVRTGVGNALSNLLSPVTFANHILQGRPDRATSTISRFVVNSTVGVLGLVDVAKTMDLPSEDTGFDDTLATWGFGTGPYIVWPIFGPYNARSSLGLVADYYADPFYYYYSHKGRDHKWPSYTRAGLTLLDQRTQILDSLDHLESTSVDFYAAVRSLHFQKATYREKQRKESTQ